MGNKLIVFEGIDGVGKTTLAKRLKHELLMLGIETIFYDEDIEDKYSGFNCIEPYIKNCVHIDSSFLFYLASSINKSKIISKLLEKQWVICDKYTYSSIAYHRLHGSRLANRININFLPILKPDYLFLILAEEKVRLERIKNRKNNNLDDLLTKSSCNIPGLFEEELKKFNPIIVNNSSDSISQITGRILDYLKQNK